jgi:hypothetical protein
MHTVRVVQVYGELWPTDWDSIYTQKHKDAKDWDEHQTKRNVALQQKVL